MKISGLLVGGLMLGAGLVVASPALADVPPIDACAELGAACSMAGPSADQPGTCKTSQCTRATPQGPMTYECKRCIAAGEGGAGAGNAGAGGADAGGAGAGGADAGGAGGTGVGPAQGGSAPDSTGGRSTSGGAPTSTGGAKTTGGAANPSGGASSPTGGSKSNAGSSGATNPGKSDDEGGCSIGSVGHERGLGGLMFALGLAGLLAARRRR